MYYTLSTFYNSAINNRKLWNYYNIQTGILNYSDLQNIENCKSLIQDTIFKGGKDDSFLYKCINGLSEKRTRHIVSTYFLGIAIYEISANLRESIGRLLSKFQINKEDCDLINLDRRFSYIWLLICLFHDLGYVIEEKECPEEEWQKLMTKFPQKVKGIPRLFGKKLLDNYANFRMCKFGVYDHGIYGGRVFYSELCRIREKREGRPGEILYWSKEMIDFYALASWVIMCHNVWMISPSDYSVDSYRCHHIDRLVRYSGDYVINSKSHPLLFLFCLVDTLDFSKLFHNAKYDYEESLRIEMSDKINLDFSNCRDFNVDAVMGMNNWLTNVDKVENILSIKL